MSICSDISSTSSLDSLTSANSYLPRAAPSEYEEPQDAESFVAELQRRHANFDCDQEQETRKEALNAWLQAQALYADQQLLQAAAGRMEACGVETAWYCQVKRESAQEQETFRQNAFDRKVQDFNTCWWLPPKRKSAVAEPSPLLIRGRMLRQLLEGGERQLT